MSIPHPGLRGSPALAALRERAQGRLQFAHADLAGYSVFAIAGDLTMLLRRGLAGAARTARHLWRMGLAFSVANGAFFLGQPNYIPAPIRGTFVPALPVLAALGLTIFWLIRTRLPRRRTATMGAA